MMTRAGITDEAEAASTAVDVFSKHPGDAPNVRLVTIGLASDDQRKKRRVQRKTGKAALFP